MFAKQFISGEIFPLKKSDTVGSAQIFMEDWFVKELPVVDGGKVLGFVKRNSLPDDEDLRVEHCMDIQVDNYQIDEHTHVFDVWSKLHENQINCLAVVNSDQQFLGVICTRDIANLAYSHSALVQEGSILVLEVSAIQYSLEEISRICESNEAKIIHLMIESMMDAENNLHVSLKLNKKYLTHVLASLERFGYKIIYTNSPSDPNHSLDDRYNWLVKYLNT